MTTRAGPSTSMSCTFSQHMQANTCWLKCELASKAWQRFLLSPGLVSSGLAHVEGLAAKPCLGNTMPPCTSSVHYAVLPGWPAHQHFAHLLPEHDQPSAAYSSANCTNGSRKRLLRLHEQLPHWFVNNTQATMLANRSWTQYKQATHAQANKHSGHKDAKLRGPHTWWLLPQPTSSKIHNERWDGQRNIRYT
jgi:hypothetical protein